VSEKPWAIEALIKSHASDPSIGDELIGPRKRGREELEEEEEEEQFPAKKRATETDLWTDIRAALAYISSLVNDAYQFVAKWTWPMVLAAKAGIFDADELLKTLDEYSTAAATRTVESVIEVASRVVSLAWRLFEYMKQVVLPAKESVIPMELDEPTQPLQDEEQTMNAASEEFGKAVKTPPVGMLTWIVNYTKVLLRKIATIVVDTITVATVKVGEIIGSVFASIPKSVYGVVPIEGIVSTAQQTAYHLLRLVLFASSILDNAPVLVSKGVEYISESLMKLKDPLQEIIQPLLVNVRAWWNGSEVLRGVSEKISRGLTWASALPYVKALGTVVDGIEWVLQWFVTVTRKIKNIQSTVLAFVYPLVCRASKRLMNTISHFIEYPSKKVPRDPREIDYQAIMDAGDVVVKLGENGYLDTDELRALKEKREIIRAAFDVMHVKTTPGEKKYVDTMNTVSLMWDASAVAARGIVYNDYQRRKDDIQFNRYIDVTAKSDESAQSELEKYLDMVKGAVNKIGAAERASKTIGVVVTDAQLDQCSRKAWNQASWVYHEWWMNADAVRALSMTIKVKPSLAYSVVNIVFKTIVNARRPWVYATIAVATCCFTVVIVANQLQKFREADRLRVAQEWVKKDGEDTVVFKTLYDRGSIGDFYKKSSEVQSSYGDIIRNATVTAKPGIDFRKGYVPGDRSELNQLMQDFASNNKKNLIELPYIPIPPEITLGPGDELTGVQVQKLDFLVPEQPEKTRPFWSWGEEKPSVPSVKVQPYVVPEDNPIVRFQTVIEIAARKEYQKTSTRGGAPDPQIETESMTDITTEQGEPERASGGTGSELVQKEETVLEIKLSAKDYIANAAEPYIKQFDDYERDLNKLCTDLTVKLTKDFASYHEYFRNARENIDFNQALKNAIASTLFSPFYDFFDISKEAMHDLRSFLIGTGFWFVGVVNLMYTVSCILLSLISLGKTVVGAPKTVGFSQAGYSILASFSFMAFGAGRQWMALDHGKVELMRHLHWAVPSSLKELLAKTTTYAFELAGLGVVTTLLTARQNFFTVAKRVAFNVMLPGMFDEISYSEKRDLHSEILTINTSVREACRTVLSQGGTEKDAIEHAKRVAKRKWEKKKARKQEQEQESEQEVTMSEAAIAAICTGKDLPPRVLQRLWT